jgi:hypothetical protein
LNSLIYQSRNQQDDKKKARLAIKAACKKVQMLEDKYTGNGKVNWKTKWIKKKTKRMKKVLLDWNSWC